MCVYIGPKTILSNILAYEGNREVTYTQACAYTQKLKETLNRQKIYPFIIFNRDEINEVLARTDAMREFNETVFVLDKNKIKAMASDMNAYYEENVRASIISCLTTVN